MVKVREDLTGKVFGRLTVLEQVDDHVQSNGRREAQWLCMCCCSEKKIIVLGNSLHGGHTQSCGCLNRERTSLANKKYNKYDLSGECGIGWTSNTNREFYFDLEDYDKIKNYCWCESLSCGTHRLVAYNGQKNILMHQLLGFKYGDHINRNALDNRKLNFRICTSMENTSNRSKMSTNTSGITGVIFRKDLDKWIAQIGVNYRCIYLGIFSDKNEAIRARLNAEAKYFKEFAPQKHLFEQYGITEQNNYTEKNDE